MPPPGSPVSRFAATSDHGTENRHVDRVVRTTIRLIALTLDLTLESVQVESIRLLPTRLQPLGQIRTTSVAGRRRPERVRLGQEHRDHRSGEVGRRGRTVPDGVEPRTSWLDPSTPRPLDPSTPRPLDPSTPRPLDAARLAGSRRRRPEQCRRQDRPGPFPPGQRKGSQSSNPTTPFRRSSRRASSSGAGVAMQRRRSLVRHPCWLPARFGSPRLPW
jgi:hypothetical protein